MSQATQGIELTAAPRHDDLLALDPELSSLIEAKGYVPAWQPQTSLGQQLAVRSGFEVLDVATLREWDSELADRLFSQSAGSVPLWATPGGHIQNGDTVLMVISQERREQLMSQDRARRAAQHQKPRTDLDNLAEQLRALGLEVPGGLAVETKDSPGTGVAIAGFDRQDLDLAKDPGVQKAIQEAKAKAGGSKKG